MRSIPIRRSLHRPDLLLGAEADLVFMSGLISMLVGISALAWLNVLAAIIFWSFSLYLFRLLAKKDPMMTKVFRRHINQKRFYPARSTPWGTPRGISFDSGREKAKGFSELLQYAAMVDDGIVLLKNGSFLAGWKFRSIDTASSTEVELEALTAQMNNAVKLLGDGWMIQVDAVRKPADYYPPIGASHFPDPVSLAIEHERKTYFETEGRHFTTENIFYVTYKPDLTAEKLSKLAYAEEESTEATPAAEKALETFRQTLAELEDALKICVTLERLRDYAEEDVHGNRHRYSSLLRAIHAAITGVDHPVILPDIPMYLDALIGGADLTGGLTPKIVEE